MKVNKDSPKKMDILIEEHGPKGMFIRKEVKNIPKHFSKATTHQCKKQINFEDEHCYKLRYLSV